VNDIAVTGDGRIIVSCSDDGLIRVWDVASAKKLYELVFSTEGSKPKAIALSPDDAYFAVGGESGYIYQWNLIDSPSVTDPHPNLRTDPIPVTKKIWSLQYIRDGAELLAGVEGGSTERYNSDRMNYPGVARNFQIAPPAKDLVDVFGPTFDFSSSAVMMGENIITSNWDGKISARQNQLLAPMYDILDRLDISKGGTILAAGGKRETIHVWDLTTNQLLYADGLILPYGHPISPDGSTIAIMVPKEIKKSITTGNLITEYFFRMRQLTGNQSSRDFSQAFPDQRVGYVHDGTIFVAGDLETSTTWDFASGFETQSIGYRINEGCRLTASGNDRNEVLQVYSPMGAFAEWKEPYASHICQLAFRFGGTLSAFSDNLELFIHSKSKTVLEGYNVLDETVAWQYPNESEISALAVSPDGKIVAFGDTSGKLVLINGRDGTYAMKIQGNFGAIRAIEFSQDTKIIVTSGDDGAVRVFGITDQKQ
jgi:WD40 repeat protein